MNSLVSIIVPCYNHEKYVKDCILSILNQTYSNIEVIICDDCSKDNSWFIINQMKEQLDKRFDRVYILRNNINCGLTKNLNKLINIATGEYIKIIASDDILAPNCIKDLMNYINTSLDNYDVIYSNAWICDESVRYDSISNKEFKLQYDNIPLTGKNLTGSICSKNFISAPTTLISRNTYKKYGLYNENYYMEDFEFWLRVSIDGSFGYLDKPTVYYRVSENSLSHYDGSDESLKRFRALLKDQFEIFYEYNDYCTHEQICNFYNAALQTSIGLLDKKSAKYIIKKMKQTKININNNLKIRYMLLKLNLYKFIRMIVKK